MSPQNRSILVGLAAPGLLWLATTVAPGQDSPPPRANPQAPTFAALLLSNGQVVRGQIVEDAAAGVYHLQTRGGQVHYPRSKVDKAAGSVGELYQFRVARLPAGDPDERIKLARWCLTEQLPAQAHEQLLAAQAMCPDDAEVRRMLYNLTAATDRAGPVDPAVRQTSGEAPAPLDPRVVGRVKKSYNALPVIFDLPPAQAVKRAGEFTRYVQPVLLQSCARCHNEKYSGTFQLVEIKNRRDGTNPDIARSNLDATLRLVNPDDPSRSDLLSAGLVPHGPNKNAIFSGPNDRLYQILAVWAKSLRPDSAAARPPTDAVGRTGFGATEPAPGDGFAADRGGSNPSPSPSPRASAPPVLPGLDVLAAGRAATPTPPSHRVVNRYDETADFSGYPDSEFQTPYAARGAAPIALPPSGPPPKPARTPAPPPAAPARVTQVSPDSVVVGTSDDPSSLPGMDKPLYPTSPGADSPSKKNKPKIDNALLEKMMKNRNARP